MISVFKNAFFFLQILTMKLAFKSLLKDTKIYSLSIKALKIRIRGLKIFFKAIFKIPKAQNKAQKKPVNKDSKIRAKNIFKNFKIHRKIIAQKV